MRKTLQFTLIFMAASMANPLDAAGKPDARTQWTSSIQPIPTESTGPQLAHRDALPVSFRAMDAGKEAISGSALANIPLGPHPDTRQKTKAAPADKPFVAREVFSSAAEAEYAHLKHSGMAIPAQLYHELFGSPAQDHGSRDGGETIGEAISIPFASGSVWTDSGTTMGYSNDFPTNQTPPATCNDSFYPSSSFDGPDVYYTFTLPGAYEVSASTCDTATYDTCLGILDDSGTLVAVNDDGTDCTGFSSLLESCCLPAGTYYLVVDSYNDNAGAYDLTLSFGDVLCADPCDELLSCEGDAEVEPNNGPAAFGGDDTYGGISCDDLVCGTTWADGGTRDTDWYELEILEESIITISCEIEAFDALIFLISDTYNTVASSDEAGVCESETLVSECLSPGDYYVWIGHNNFDGVPVEQGYALNVSCSPCDLVSPCDNPVLLHCGGTYIGSTVERPNFVNNSSGDFFFQIEVAEDGPAAFDLCHDDTNYDTYLSLWDDCPISGGTLLAENDDACGLQSHLDVELAAGSYWLVVDGYDSAEGDFTLIYTCSACEPVLCDGVAELEPNNGPSLFGGDDTFSPALCGQTSCGTTWADDGVRDVDWYSLELETSSYITVTAEVDLFNAQLLLFDGAFTPMIQVDDNGTCGPEHLETLCMEAGTYYIWMGPTTFDGVPYEQNYSLTIDCEPCIIPEPCEDPVILACGDSWSGSTEGMFNFVNNLAGDVFIQVNLALAGPVTFSLCGDSTDFDSYLSLWDACPLEGGLVLAENDDACDLQSELTVDLEAGTYWLVVDGNGESEGAFTLSVSCSNCENILCEGVDEAEPNNGPLDLGGDDTFGEISCGQTICGTVWAYDDSRDTDWFVLDLQEDSWIGIDAVTEMFDARILFTDELFSTILDMDEGGLCEGESIDSETIEQCFPAGVYHIMIAHNALSGVPEEQPYALSLTCSPCEIIDPCDTIHEIQCGDELVGGSEMAPSANIWEEYCEDGETGPEVVYELAHEGGFLQINLASADTSDLDLILLGSCNPLDCLEMPWSVGPNESISGSFDAGTYFIVVDCYNWDGSEYAYTLELSCEPDPCEGLLPVECVGTPEVEPNQGWNADPPNSSFGEIQNGETICGTIWAHEGSRDLDWFRFEHSGGSVYLDADVDEMDCVLMLTELDPDGEILSTSNVLPMCGDEQLIHEDLPAGSYFAVITHNGFDEVPVEQNYSLLLTADTAVLPAVPANFQLRQNYPNPFNPVTTISWTQPELSHATLSVFNLVGATIQSFDLGIRAAGSHTFVWDAHSLASGVYIYAIEAGDDRAIRKAVLLR